jgi:hypothetical protein
VVAVELRRGINSFKEFLKETKTKLDPAIYESTKVIEGVKSSVNDVNEVTQKVRELAGVMEKLIVIISELIFSVDKFKSSLSIRSNALKTAISVAASVFLENIKKGGR